MRLGVDFLTSLVANQADGNLHQIPDNLFNVAAHIANFGKLGRFHLYKRRTGQFGQPA